MEDDTFTFHFETRLPVCVEEAFKLHKQPGMFVRLSPPFIPMKVLTPYAPLEEGALMHFKLFLAGDAGIECLHKITHLEENESFIDEQIKGPFSYWKHLHKFRAIDDQHCVIEEIIEYRLPLESFLGQLVNGKIARRLTQIFNYRREVLKNDLEFRKLHPQKKKLHILMTGSTGLVGSALTPFLRSLGHIVTPIQRHLSAGEEGIFWDIENQKIEPSLLENSDAVIHLAGENIAQNWTEQKKEAIYKSRILSTHLLAKTLNTLNNPPKTFICASGVNYYRSGEEATEEGAAGEGFLYQVIKDWEEETQALHHMRVVNMRTGVVLSPKGGMLKKVLKAFKWGLGSTIGDGSQHLSWISIDDLVYLYAHVLFTDSIRGPLNATSPYPVTNNTFSKLLAKKIKRPLFLKVPSGFIKALTGGMGEETILQDLIVLPGKLSEEQYPFCYPKLESALHHLLGDAD